MMADLEQHKHTVKRGFECIELPMEYCLFFQVVGDKSALLQGKCPQKLHCRQTNRNAVNVGQPDQSEATQLEIYVVRFYGMQDPVLQGDLHQNGLRSGPSF